MAPFTFMGLRAARVRSAIAGLFLLLPAVCSLAAESYTFAVVPQFEQRKLFATWEPIVAELIRQTGLDLKLVATLNVPEFEKELARGSFDFVYANPYHIMREAPRQGYIPLVRDRQPLRGILVVRKDDPIKSPAELDGKTLAIPSLNALGASLLLRADLERVFKVRMKPVNAKTHSSVYLNVANGLTDAGGGVEKTLREQERSVQGLLRVLYTTRDMPSHPVAAHPRVPPGIRDKVQRAMLDLADTERGRSLLAEVPMTAATAASIADYRVMSGWGLESYWVD